MAEQLRGNGKKGMQHWRQVDEDCKDPLGSPIFTTIVERVVVDVLKLPKGQLPTNEQINEFLSLPPMSF